MDESLLCKSPATHLIELYNLPLIHTVVLMLVYRQQELDNHFPGLLCSSRPQTHHHVPVPWGWKCSDYRDSPSVDGLGFKPPSQQASILLKHCLILTSDLSMGGQWRCIFCDLCVFIVLTIILSHISNNIVRISVKRYTFILTFRRWKDIQIYSLSCSFFYLSNRACCDFNTTIIF